MDYINAIIELKTQLKDAEAEVESLKKSLRNIAKLAYENGVRDVDGQYEVRCSYGSEFNGLHFKTAYEPYYNDYRQFLVESYVPDVNKTGLKKYLIEERNIDPEEAERMIEECSKRKETPSYNVYTYPKKGVSE